MLHLALLWHQHQPIYKDTGHPTPQGSYTQPWVRLHALRDYYAMAEFLLDYPAIHLTINLTPALLWQIEDYLERGATDQHLEWTKTPAEQLSFHEREAMLGTFFDADWHHQIDPHPRYAELFRKRQAREPFTDQDIRDLQLWSNLSWFGEEFRFADRELTTGETVRVRRFVEQERDFRYADVLALVDEQYKIMRAILPLLQHLQQCGQIEVSTTPFYHPILPLVIDTDQATIERPGNRHPSRFQHPEDATDQVARTVAAYTRWFGQSPTGMWPAEGAVSQASVPLFARHGIRWIATDRGVLARSGRWGYNVDDPQVLGQPYRAEEGDAAISIFFRDTALSDAIGFRYARMAGADQAVEAFLRELRDRFVSHLPTDQDAIVPVILDGENAWSAYPEDARPFLHTLYRQLEHEPGIQTVTFREYLEGSPERNVTAHSLEQQTKVYDLFTASWIDASGSGRGVDLDTWIGGATQNRAWELLRAARDTLSARQATPTSAPQAFAALAIAEGSDWFWWYSETQDSGHDDRFDDLFRRHLKQIYRALGQEPPTLLESHLVEHAVLWTFTHPVDAIQPGDRLTIRTNCPGVITWWHPDQTTPTTVTLQPVGGVMTGVRRFQTTLGPFAAGEERVLFRFTCTFPGCDHLGVCCTSDEHQISLTPLANTPRSVRAAH